MVTAAKRKSSTELKQEILKAFNDTISRVESTIKTAKFKKTKYSVHYNKVKKESSNSWTSKKRAKATKPSVTFIFRTNQSRFDLMQQIVNTLQGYGIKFVGSSTLSGMGHLEFTNKLVDSEGNPTKPPKSITFYFVVKYKDSNAFRSLPYTNPLLESKGWKRKFRNRSPDTSEEHRILKKMNDDIFKLGMETPVDLVIEPETYGNIIGFIPGSSGTHADFVGIDKDLNEVCFLSHKMGTDAKHFQQYSGISVAAGMPIYSDPEVQSFSKIIANKDENEFNNQSFSRDIENSELQTMGIFGPDYGGGVGHNSCTHFMQGNVNVSRRKQKKKADVNAEIQITFSTKNIHRSDAGQLINSSEYAPTLGARKGEDSRTVRYGSNVVSGVRGGIFSSAYIKGRSNNIELPVDDSEIL